MGTLREGGRVSDKEGAPGDFLDASHVLFLDLSDGYEDVFILGKKASCILQISPFSLFVLHFNQKFI